MCLTCANRYATVIRYKEIREFVALSFLPKSRCNVAVKIFEYIFLSNGQITNANIFEELPIFETRPTRVY